MILRKRHCLHIIAATFLSVCAQAIGSTTGSSPVLNVPPAQYWDGVDGKWSSFGLQLGTPAQDIRVLPMTQQGSIFAVLPEGCTSRDSSDCPSSRGSLFFTNRTSTWQQEGLYGLYTVAEQPLGYSGNGLYGYDNVTIGWPGDNMPSIKTAVITGIATKDFYLGGLPLNPWSLNFTTLTQSTPSLMTLLKNESKIPSLSYGYTAGYYNNNPPAAAGLTLGGFDRSRFVANNISFTMTTDISRDLLVSIQSITTGSTKLLSQPIFALLDSSIPTIWLPLDACQAFETAFNLTWNATAQLYLVSDTLHSQLQQLNPTVSFRIGPQSTGDSLTIDMPDGAFDLETQPPFSPKAGRYFPLKRANDSSQYTLGRAFFQSAYVVANYENYNFSVHQAKYPASGIAADLVTLPAKGAATAKSASTTLSTGAIAGIAVAGAIVGLVALGLALYFFLFKKRQSKKQPEPNELGDHQSTGDEAQLDAEGTTVHETDGRQIGNKTGMKATGHELGGKSINHELHGDHKHPHLPRFPVELPVNEVPASEVHNDSVQTRETIL